MCWVGEGRLTGLQEDQEVKVDWQLVQEWPSMLLFIWPERNAVVFRHEIADVNRVVHRIVSCIKLRLMTVHTTMEWDSLATVLCLLGLFSVLFLYSILLWSAIKFSCQKKNFMVEN